MPLNDPPQVPPIVAVYPAFGVTVKVVVEPLFTVLDAGLIVPPVPADADTVRVWIFAEQLTIEPPLDPVQLHVHGPMPFTTVAVPALHRLVVGAVVNVPPLDVPQTPLTGLAVNVAVTVFATSIVTVHVPVPEHPLPVQPAKVELTDGEAVRVTEVLALYGSEQSAPQLIPAREDVTVPVPLPALLTVKLLGCTAAKLALIVRLPVTFVKV